MISLNERTQTEPSIWIDALWQFGCKMRVAVPGVIQSFDPSTQLATVQIAIQENVCVPVPQPNGLPPITGQKQTVAIAPLQAVPVMFPRAGGFSLVFPVNAGDECLLVFSDACISAWKQSGGVQKQIRRRRHDLSDAVAIVGLWNQTRVFTDYPTDHIELRSDDGAVKLKLSETQVQMVTPSNNPQTLATKAFFDWVNNDLLPWAKSNGYSGPNPPANSVTVLLESE